MIRRMIGKREARRRFSDDVGVEKGVGWGGERERKREEVCGDVEMDCNDVKLINVCWKEH